MFDALYPEAADAGLQTRIARPILPPPAPGMFKNAISGAGKYFMRSMAEAGRAVSMAGAALPVANDLVHGGTQEQDKYFAAHDELFQSAVDYWTPKPGEVGVAGQVIGTVAGGLTQFLASPPLMVGTAMLSTSEDLVRQGVDPSAAVLAGDIAGLGAVAGIALPIAGKTLTQRMATGVAGNLGQGVAQAGATQAVLNAADAPPSVTAAFDPFDVQNRTVDALMGLAFGAAAHVGAKRPELTPEQTDALLLLNQVRHMEHTSMPGKPDSPADLAASVRATRQAIDQILRGERVNVDGEVRFSPDEAKAAVRSEIERTLTADAAPPEPPIARSDMGEPVTAPDTTPADAGGQPQAPRFAEDLMIPTGEFDSATGQPVAMKANDYVARTQAELAEMKTNGRNLFMTAAECLLGAA